MSFDAYESSRAEGRPISLYFFRYGDTEDAYFAYTDADKSVSMEFDVDLGPVIFSATPIKRGAITVSGSLDKASLEIRTAQNTDLADLFISHPPSQEVILTIWDGHIGLDDFAVVWSGRVTNHGSNANEATYNCEPVSTSLRRTGLTRNFQIPCPLVLYGPDCRADPEPVTIVVTPASINGPLVGLASNWAPDDEKGNYVAGYATWVRVDGRTERRTVVRLADADNTLVLSGSATGLTTLTALNVTLGCPHSLAGCNLHNNIQNYGGQWLIPTENPFGVKNNFN